MAVEFNKKDIKRILAFNKDIGELKVQGLMVRKY